MQGGAMIHWHTGNHLSDW